MIFYFQSLLEQVQYIYISMQISKLRSVKRNKKIIQTNPQVTAQDQLIQISQFSDQEQKIQKSDKFIDDADTKYLQQQHMHGQIKRFTSMTLSRYQKTQQRNSQSAQSKYIRNSKETINKSVLSPINYILIGKRVSSTLPKTISYQPHQGLKSKLIPKKEKIRYLSRTISPPLKEKQKRIKSLRGHSVCAIEIKDCTILKKYSSLYYIN